MSSTRLLHAAIVLLYVLLGGGGMYLLKSAILTRPEPGPLPAMIADAILSTITNTRFVLGFLLYAASFTTWLVLLRLLPLSSVFPVTMGAMLIGTQIIGAMMLGERLTTPHLAGVMLISLGMALVFIATPPKSPSQPTSSPNAANEHTAPSTPQ